MASDGVARGGTGSVVVSRCVFVCGEGGECSERLEVAVGSVRREKTGWGLSEFRER